MQVPWQHGPQTERVRLKKLRLVREALGLSRWDVVFRLRSCKGRAHWPISESTLSNYESGRTDVPRDRVWILAKVLGCEKWDLI